MSVAATASKKAIKESNLCPVFKINLKGQFVNIDDLTSELLGLPSENLFGLNIKEFLDKDSFAGLSEIMQNGSRFDTSYESIELNIINYDEKQQRVQAIVCQNFIAGNPSNYQIIISKYSQSEKTTKANDTKSKIDSTLKELYELLADFRRNPDYKKITEILIKNRSINQIAIYKYNNKDLSLLAASTKQNVKDKIDLSKTNKDHLRVIKEEEQSATINLKDNLREYYYPLVIGGICWGLLRFVTELDSPDLESDLGFVAGYIGPAFGIDHTANLFAVENDNKQNDEKSQKIQKNKKVLNESNSDFFDILKMFGCTVISFESGGVVVPAFTDIPDKDHFLVGCTNLGELLDKIADFELISFPGKDYQELTLSAEDRIKFPDLGLISDENNYYLYKILQTQKISEGLVEYSIVLFPGFNNSIGHKSIDKLLNRFLSTTALFLEPIDKCAAKMAGQFYPRLNKDGRFYIDTIQDNCRVLARTVKRYKQLNEIISQKENIIENNITEIVTKAIKIYQVTETELDITLTNSEQIYFKTDERKFTESLFSVFNGLVNQSDLNENLSIKLQVAAETDYCMIQITLCGTLSDNFDPQTALEPLGSINNNPTSGLTVYENELPFALLLVESMGGEMELAKPAGNQITINIKLPAAR